VTTSASPAYRVPKDPERGIDRPRQMGKNSADRLKKRRPRIPKAASILRAK
jgi:hypothetical protein